MKPISSVHIVGGDYMIAAMFEGRGFQVVEEAEGADLLCFTGGADVSPDLYGDMPHPTSHCNRARDDRERVVFEAYRDVPKVGICRGSQFLNVMSGGTLWQDVDNHAIGGTHQIYYMTKDNYNFAKVNHDDWGYANELQSKKYDHIAVTSTHHQMMKVDKDTAEVWGIDFRSRFRDRGRDRRRAADFIFSPDIEIANYKHTKSLCFQAHPEYGVKSCEDLFFKTLTRAFG